MKKNTVKIVAVVLGIFVMLSGTNAFAKGKMASAKLTTRSVELKLALRDLWTGHIFWVRNVVLMTKLGSADAVKIAEEQVVQNARAIADSIGPIYGKAASDKLFELLAGHYGAVKEYMTTAYANDSTGKSVAVDKIKKNADEIATFLSSANPNWPKDAVLGLLMAHGGHHIAQIDQINSNNFSAEAQTVNTMQKHIYAIADALADGIVKQFPKKF
jgi:hypothetical protein